MSPATPVRLVRPAALLLALLAFADGLALTGAGGGPGLPVGDGIGSAEPGVESSPPGLPQLRLTGPEVALDSASDFDEPGAATLHRIEVGPPPPGGGTLEVTVVGAYGASYRTATASTEGALVGVLGDSTQDCLPVSLSFPVPAEEMITLAGDGLVEVSVENSPEVGPTCGVNRHTVELRYEPAVDRVDFDGVFLGGSAEVGLVVHNDGTGVLEVHSISTDGAGFSSDVTYLLVAPGESSPLQVRFAPAAAGPVQGTLRLATNDPVRATMDVPLSAVALVPPVLGAAPGALSATLAAGQGETQTLTVLNTGGSDLEFRVEPGPPSGGGLGGGACAPARAYVVEGQTGGVSIVDLATGLRSPVASDVSDAESIAVNGAGTWAYVSRPAAGEVVRVDLTTGLTAAVASGLGEPAGLCLRDDEALAYVVQADRGELSAIDLASGRITPVASGLGEPHGVAVDRSGTTALVTDPASGRLLSVELATGTVREIVSGLDEPDGVSWSADGISAIVTTRQGGELLSIDAGNGSVTTLATGLAAPAALSLDLGGEVAYVLESGESRLASVELATGLVADVAAMDGGPLGLTLGIPAGCDGSFLSVSPLSGSVPPSGSLDLSVRFDAAGLGAEAYAAELVLRSNDPAVPRLGVPVTLAVTSGPAISLTETLESVIFYAVTAAATTHRFPVSDTTGRAATVEVDALGDFGSFNELAEVSMEGSSLGLVGNSGGGCQTLASGSFAVPGAVFQGAGADGTVEVVVANNIAVDASCPVNSHTVRLLITSGSAGGTFGTVFVGEAKDVRFIVSNVGTETLDVFSIATDAPEFQPSVTSASIPPGGSQDVIVTFLTASPGSFSANLTFTSNDPVTPVLSVPLTAVAVAPPAIAVTPASLSEDLFSGQVSTQTLTISNDGGNDLLWDLTVELPPGPTEVIDASPIFPSTGAVTDTGDATSAPPPPAPEDLYTFAPVSSEEATAAFLEPSLEAVLTALDDGFAGITQLIPGRFDFTGGESGTSISDGGADMYDGGNFLETDLGGPFPYSDGVIATTVFLPGTCIGGILDGFPCDPANPADACLAFNGTCAGGVFAPFGANGRYFTRKVPGLFVLAADLDGVDGFTISGNLGADGLGSVNGTILQRQRGAVVYRGFVKRVFGTSNPSVNHLIIVPSSPDVGHTFSTNTNDDFHELFNLAASTRIYYLLYATNSGLLVDDAATGTIMDAFLDLVATDFLTASPDQGAVPGGGTQDVTVTFDATRLPGGTYGADIVIGSNDPETPQVTVPVVLSVTGTPDISVSVTDLSFGSLFTGQTLDLSLGIDNGGTDVLNVTSISSDLPEFTPSATSLTIPSGGSETLTVTFAPTTPGTFTGALTVASNDVDEPVITVALSGVGVDPPVIGVTPTSLTEDLLTNQTSTQTLTLSNNGNSDLVWGLEVTEAGSAAILDASPLFTSSQVTVVKADDLSAPPDAPAPSELYVSAPAPAPAEGTVTATSGPDLPDVLAELNARFSEVTDLIPARFDFIGGDAGSSISDGGSDMYDGGNFLGTNFGSSIPYSEDVITDPGPAFGPSGRYFTRKVPGLFVLGADTNGIDRFAISGNLGADGFGSVDGTVLEVQRGPVRYRGFVKRVFNAGNPSVNHLIIVPSNPDATHSFAISTDNDFHEVTGLASGTRLYYLLYASASGGFVDDDATTAIMEAFLDLFSPPFLSASPESGTLAPGLTEDITVTFDATALFGGDYAADIVFSSNDPVTPAVIVPAFLTVTGVPDIRVTTSALDFGTLFTGQSRSLSLEIDNIGTADLIVSIGADLPEFTASAASLTIPGRDSDAVTVTFTPTVAGTFNGTLTLASNDPDTPEILVAVSGIGLDPPVIGVTPAALTEDLLSGETSTQVMTLSNSGASDLDWQIDLLPGTGSVSTVDISPVFTSTVTTEEEKEPTAPPPPPAPEDRYRFEPAAVETVAAGRGEPSLEDVLAALNDGFADVTALVPARFDFSGGDSGSSIFDGGSDMYDGGNFLSTDIRSSIAYSDNAIVNTVPGSAGVCNGGVLDGFPCDPANPADACLAFTGFCPAEGIAPFGPNGRYFTRKVPGLFVLAADMDGVDSFTISGNLGADGLGSVGGVVLDIQRGGISYRAFVKRVFGTSDPSVNHLILVPSNPEAGHDFSGNTNDDFHQVFNLTSSTRIYYLLYASASGGFIDDATNLAIAQAFLDLLAPGFLSVSPESGTVPAGASQDVAVTFDATGLFTGQFDADVVIGSNDPVTPVVVVPATLGVTGVPDISVVRDEVVLESTRGYSTSGDLTTHSLPITIQPPANGTLEVIADGDYGDGSETATVTVEGNVLGSFGGSGPDCSPATGVFPLDAALLGALASDGAVEVEVQNSPTVDVFCPTNLHTVRLSYGAPVEVLDFGTLFTEQSRSIGLTVQNLGTEVLVVGIIDSDLPEFTPSPSSLIIPPGGSEALDVTFAPTVAGTFDGTLNIVSDDPDSPVITLSLSGVALDPPVIGAVPASLSESLFTGQTSVQIVTLSNTGGSDLDWELLPLDAPTLRFLDVTPPAGTVPAGGSQDLVVTFDATALVGGTYNGGIVIASNDPATPELRVPAQLVVTGAPDLIIEGESVLVESAIDYAVDGALTQHSLAVPAPPGGGGTIELIADGDFGSASETATLSVEGTVLGSVGGVGTDCFSASATFALDAAFLAALASDGTIAAEVQNSANVGVFCATNRHTVRLSYAGPATLEFGTRFIGTSSVRAIVLRNLGTEVLEVTSISSDLPEFVPSATSLTIPVGGLEPLEVVFSSPVAGSFDGTLSIASNDPDSPLAAVPLSAAAAEPPVVGVSPASLQESLFTGQTSTRTLTVSNGGGVDLDFDLRIAGREAPGGGCVPGLAYLAELGANTVRSVDLVTGESTVLASGLQSPQDLALSPSRDLLYVTEFRAGRLSAIDIATGAVTTVATGLVRPVGVDLDALGATAYVTDVANGRLLTVDLATGAVGTLAVGLESPQIVELSSDETLAYVTDFDASSLLSVDLASGTVSIIASGLQGPAGLSLDRNANLAFLSEFSGGAVASVDLATGAVQREAVGFPLPRGVALDPTRARVFVTTSPALGRLERIDLLDGATAVIGNVGAAPYGIELDCSGALFSTEPATGSVPPGGSTGVSVLFDAIGVLAQTYEADIEVASNDPLTPTVTIPTTLVVTGAPDIEVRGPEVSLESSADFSTSGATTQHAFSLDAPPGGGGTIELIADGDFGFPPEVATVTAEGMVLGSTVPTGVDCAAAEAAFPIAAGDLSLLAADGVIEVEVQNDLEVDPFCFVNNHTVRVRYVGPRDQDFGGLFVGLTAEATVSVENQGTDLLQVTSINSDLPEFSASPAAFSVPPRGSRAVTVTFAPSAATLFEGTLSIISNDPDEGEVRVAVRGEGIEPPVIAVSPDSLADRLQPGESSVHELLVENQGGSDLLFDVQVLSTLADQSVLFGDDMESGANGWSHSSTHPNGQDLWGQSTARSRSGSTSWHVGQHLGEGSDALLSPPLDLAGLPDATLTFWHWYEFDDCDSASFESDGGIVEVSTDGGTTWTQVFPEEGYPYTLDDICGNPLAFLAAYSHASDAGAEFVPATIDLTPFVGDVVRVRFHAGWDCGNCAGNEGWYIDDVTVTTTSPEWIDAAPLSGTVPPGLAASVQVTLDATGQVPGPLSAQVRVVSNDPLSPEVTVPVDLTVFINTPPTAVLAAPAQAECSGPDGAIVTLDGSGSTDPDSTPGTNDDIVLFEWFEDLGLPSEVPLGTGATLAVTLPLGPHSISLVVTDTREATGTATAIVTIVDTGPPTLTVVPDRASLWPPNHALVPVEVAIEVNDVCDPSPLVVLASASSSEADNAAGTGDGDTDGDVAGADLGTRDATIELRAERDGAGAGRTYELRYAATDASGNTTPAMTVVNVPHDLGDGPDPILMQVEPAAPGDGVRLLWPAVPGASSYDVIAGGMSALQTVDQVLLLGDVSVLGRTTTATSLTDDGPPPPRGEGIFYLVQYRTEQGGSGFGAESAPWPRQPVSCEGGCP